MDTYNGWTNYETWNVKLWIDNDEHEQTHWLKRSQNVDASELAGQLKDYYRYKMNPLADKASTYSDLLGSALDRVNWREIAEALKEDAEEIPV